MRGNEANLYSHHCTPKSPREGFDRNKNKCSFFHGQHLFEEFFLSYCQAALRMQTENLKLSKTKILNEFINITSWGEDIVIYLFIFTN